MNIVMITISTGLVVLPLPPSPSLLYQNLIEMQQVQQSSSLKETKGIEVFHYQNK